MQNETDIYNYKTYSAVDFVIGLFITLGASIVNALGLNITKLDHTRQENLPTASRRPDWARPLWYLGLILYIASQLLGSTLALEYLRAEYVAPLGSTSLVFNFIFAYLLVGTPVQRTDVLGTVIIVLGVVGVVLFGNQRISTTEFDKESNLSLSLLKELWGRKDWIAYITVLEVTTVFFFWFSTIANEVCMNRIVDERGDADRGAGVDEMVGHGGGRRAGAEGKWGNFKYSVTKNYKWTRRTIKKTLEGYMQSQPDNTIRKFAGLCWSITGGLLAGQSLVFAKSAVKLVSSAINKTDPNEANQFTSPLTWLIVVLLVVTAVAQVYCLNASLKCYDSTFTVPIFFATYTTCGFVNSLVYLDELHTYRLWVFLCIWASIAVLIVGVVLLSIKKPVARPRAASVLAEEGDPANRYDDVHLTPALGSPSLGEDGGKGQGWLGKIFTNSKIGGRIMRSEGVDPNSMEMGRKERRGRPGVQKLDDADSILAPESERSGPGGGAREVEMDEVDRLGYSTPTAGASGKVFEADDFDEDDFGDFKEADSEVKKDTR